MYIGVVDKKKTKVFIILTKASIRMISIIVAYRSIYNFLKYNGGL